MSKRKYLFIISLFIGLVTLFPPFSLRGNRQWGFLFNPPVSIDDRYYIKTAVGQIDWSILVAEYIIAIVIGIILVCILGVIQDKKRIIKG